MRSPALLRVAVLAAPLLASPAPASAQNSPSGEGSATPGPRGWLVGASVGVPLVDGAAIPDLFTIGINWTQLRPGRLGADFSLGTMPRALTEGVIGVIHGAGSAGLRTGVTWHRFGDARGAVWLWEVGMVRVPRSLRDRGRW